VKIRNKFSKAEVSKKESGSENNIKSKIELTKKSDNDDEN
jgi:hypothetical protein